MSAPILAEGKPSFEHRAGGAQALPLGLIGQAIPMLTRHELAAITERLLERLDEIDGDPELEDDNEDCCASHDDDPQWHYADPLVRPGDEADAEEDDHSGTDLDRGELDNGEGAVTPSYGIDQRIMLQPTFLSRKSQRSI